MDREEEDEEEEEEEEVEEHNYEASSSRNVCQEFFPLSHSSSSFFGVSK